MKKHICPYCQADITDVIKMAIREQTANAGKAKTAKKSASSRSNWNKAMEAIKDKYTPEKRAIAAQKRRETMAKKKLEK